MSRKCCTLRSRMMLLLRLLRCHRHTKPVKLSGRLQLFLSHRCGHRAAKYFPSHPFSASRHLVRPTVLPGNFQRPLLHRNVLRRYFQNLAQACVLGSDYIAMLHVSGRLLHGVNDGQISLFLLMFVHVEGTRERSSLCAAHSIFQLVTLKVQAAYGGAPVDVDTCERRPLGYIAHSVTENQLNHAKVQSKLLKRGLSLSCLSQS